MLKKYNIGDEVIVKYNKQVSKGIVLKVKKTWFGYRYIVLLKVEMYDKGKFCYTTSRYKNYWQRQIIGLNKKNEKTQ